MSDYNSDSLLQTTESSGDSEASHYQTRGAAAKKKRSARTRGGKNPQIPRKKQKKDDGSDNKKTRERVRKKPTEGNLWKISTKSSMVAKEPILKNRLVICLERVDEQNAHNAFKEKTDEQSLLETKPGTSTSQPTVQPDGSTIKPTETIDYAAYIAMEEKELHEQEKMLAQQSLVEKTDTSAINNGKQTERLTTQKSPEKTDENAMQENKSAEEVSENKNNGEEEDDDDDEEDKEDGNRKSPVSSSATEEPTDADKREPAAPEVVKRADDECAELNAAKIEIKRLNEELTSKVEEISDLNLSIDGLNISVMETNKQLCSSTKLAKEMELLHYSVKNELDQEKNETTMLKQKVTDLEKFLKSLTTLIENQKKVIKNSLGNAAAAAGANKCNIPEHQQYENGIPGFVQDLVRIARRMEMSSHDLSQSLHDMCQKSREVEEKTGFIAFGKERVPADLLKLLKDQVKNSALNHYARTFELALGRDECIGNTLKGKSPTKGQLDPDTVEDVMSHTLSVFGADQDQGDIKNSYSTFCSKSGTWLRERNNGTPEIREILEKKLKDMGGKYVSE